MLRSLRLPQFSFQLWLLFGGTLLSSSGQSLVWPFLTINIREQLGVPLTTITLLFTAQSIAVVPREPTSAAAASCMCPCTHQR